MSDFTIEIDKHLSRLGKEIQEFVEKVMPVGMQEGDFFPPCDILESADQFKIVMDLPGLDKEEIQIRLKDHILSISGERILDSAGESESTRSERKGGAFSRSFSVPENTETGKIEARSKNGVLTITLPVKESEEGGESIPVR